MTYNKGLRQNDFRFEAGSIFAMRRGEVTPSYGDLMPVSGYLPALRYAPLRFPYCNARELSGTCLTSMPPSSRRVMSVPPRCFISRAMPGMAR